MIDEESQFESYSDNFSLKCKATIYCVAFLLNFLPFISLGILYFLYDWFIGFGGLVFSYIVTGVIISKLRISSLDVRSREFSYKTLDIVKIYFLKHHC